MPADPDKRSATDRAITERAQGKADRLLLGTSSHGTMLRLAGLVLAFILVGGTIMYLLNPLN
ncbi:hypothetical protein [Devosia elaeis]|uniref:Uncharacterized protein n=1 Tax=Devosia elaeis TaxID=1770058 RepID=A0A178HWU0_9HYPH|nr:hypothetical protein [Devosia elaeis]OAM77097.1 hypothetical protein A3840_10705 [Devosia elaeis]